MTTSSMPASSMLRDDGLVELGVRRDEHLAGERVDDVFQRDAAEDAVGERLDDLAGVLELGHADAVEGAAIELRDDGVLRDVDETAREVTGVRRLERGVGEALTSAVRRDEVLEHAETLAEVRGDRRLDDLARRLRHEATHGGQLANLLGGAAGSGVGHDVDRVEARLDVLLARLRIDDLLFADADHHLPVTLSATPAQMSTILLYRSPSVIRPSWY